MLDKNGDEVVQQQQQQNNNNNNNNGDGGEPPKVIRFRPGTLRNNITSSQSLSFCYCDTNVYRNHMTSVKRISITDSFATSSSSAAATTLQQQQKQQQQYNNNESLLAYVMLTKSGSSTARVTMKTIFGAHEIREQVNQSLILHGGDMVPNVTTFTFVRDPLSRFFSGYDEAFHKTAPYHRRGIKDGTHPFPFLHEGINSKQDYSDLFCPPHVRNGNPTNNCTHTYENGTLASRLERFVSQYDGLSPFNGHLELQVPKLSFYDTGEPYHLDVIYNTANSDEGWKSLVHNYVPPGFLQQDSFTIQHSHSRYRRFDITRISNTTKQRICELAMIDYCCLNLPLPPPCSNLFCKLSRRPKDEDKDVDDDGLTNNNDGGGGGGIFEWRIEPWRFPHE